MTTLADPNDETSVLLEDSAHTFLSSEHRPERLRAIYRGESALDRRFWEQLAQQGWLALRWPESLGGSGLAPSHAGIVAEQFGRHAVPEPLVACAAMPAALAEALADSNTLDRWRPAAGGCIGGTLVTTLAWQDDPQMLEARTSARVRADAGGYRLQGRKFGVVAGSFADLLVVFAGLDGEPALWSVPRTCEGVSLQEFRTSDGSTVATVGFEDVALQHSALLARGEQVRQALELAIDEALLLTAAQLIGVTDAALAQTLEYMRVRVQFGRHIGSFQSLQHLAVDVRVELSLARASYLGALQRFGSAARASGTRAAIAAAKARASDAALMAGRFGVQAHGAVGFAAETDIGLFLKSALRLAAFLGNGSQQRERYGRMAGLHETLA